MAGVTQVVDKASPVFRRLARDTIGSRRHMQMLGGRIVHSIRTRTPADTGALRDSSGVIDVKQNSLTVGYLNLLPRGPRRPNIPQARAIEFGTRFIRAYRAIRLAIAKHRGDIERTYGLAVQSHLDSLPRG